MLGGCACESSVKMATRALRNVSGFQCTIDTHGNLIFQGRSCPRRPMPASRLLPVFMILALALTGLAHSPTGTAPIVTDGMTTGEFGQILEKARAMEKAKSCGRRMLEDRKPFTLEELAGAKVKRIRVVRAETYKIWPAPKPEEIRATVEKMWSRKFGRMACQIEWADGALW